MNDKLKNALLILLVLALFGTAAWAFYVCGPSFRFWEWG